MKHHFYEIRIRKAGDPGAYHIIPALQYRVCIRLNCTCIRDNYCEPIYVLDLSYTQDKKTWNHAHYDARDYEITVETVFK